MLSGPFLLVPWLLGSFQSDFAFLVILSPILKHFLLAPCLPAVFKPILKRFLLFPLQILGICGKNPQKTLLFSALGTV